MAIDVGEPIPLHTAHAVSVSLPSWAANVGYEENEEWVASRMKTGYPRFFINTLIDAFAKDIVKQFGKSGEKAMLFPSIGTASRCVDFVTSRDPSLKNQIRVVNLILNSRKTTSELLLKLSPAISAVVLAEDKFSIAREFWQHTGEGVSSRRAEFCHNLFREGLLVESKPFEETTSDQVWLPRGPRRYRRGGSADPRVARHENSNGTSDDKDQSTHADSDSDDREFAQFIEERFGRNLDVSFVDNAKSAIRRRIAGSLIKDVDLTADPSPQMESSARGVAELSEDDVYLYPCGMNSVFNVHRMLLATRGSMKSIMFGFPYVDCLKVLQKFGPGCLFYGNGLSEDLDDLERRLKAGERYLALFCEFPGNPLLRTPDLKRIRALADTYNFAVVVDETIGNFINVNILPHADVLVSSLTKIFSGECNVMGGGTILNPRSKYYKALKDILALEYEDNYWPEDVIFMERNSRDFVSRIERINANAEAICEILLPHPSVKAVYYPKHAPTRRFYDACRTPSGGYGGLLSISFHHKVQAIAFHDAINTAKGPSLGTNFTLSSPYVLIAHFSELDWVQQFGVDPNLVRVSVGLEDEKELRDWFSAALRAAELTGC